MPIRTPDFRTLLEFKECPDDILERMQRTHSPLALTVDGKVALVVQDAESYGALIDRLDLIDAVEGIQRGLDEMAAGKGRPAEEVFAEFQPAMDF